MEKRENRRNYRRILAYTCFRSLVPFSSVQGLGRVALLGSALGFLWGFHFILWTQLSLHLIGATACFAHVEAYLGSDRLQLLWQWCAYCSALCAFHMLEFFVTAIYNPTQATADSFLINHSTAYTAAALTSWTEFWLRACFVPGFNVVWLSLAGFVIVLASQFVRSAAMATAGESFNHLIQTAKKQNHVLITHGIYSVFRHPSYVGFFYWSVSTQLLLGNLVHTTAFAVVSWSFFQRRIDYEEESLCQFFPDAYPAYVARTYMGIPFLKTKVDTSQVAIKKAQ
jgi:protein-S-isoprenylcysteine O-methyltransferase